MQGSDILIGYFHFSQQLYQFRIAGTSARQGRCNRQRSQVRKFGMVYPFPENGISVCLCHYIFAAWHVWQHGFLYNSGLSSDTLSVSYA